MATRRDQGGLHGPIEGEPDVARALACRLHEPLHAASHLLEQARAQPSEAQIVRALDALQPALDALSAVEAYLDDAVAEPEDIDLQAWLASRPSSAELVVESDVVDTDEPIVVHVDRAQLDRAVDELLENALQAGASRVSFGVERRGAELELRIQDDGRGIEEALVDRAFEPLVRGDGGGQGLGLARVARFARAHGGSARAIAPADGPGTIIALTLPIRRRSSAEPRSSAGSPVATVLVVDDEPLALKAARRALERGGYRVITAESATDALATFERVGRVDVLLSDVVMPDMSGVELGRAISERQPHIAQVFTSGYPKHDVAELPESANFIEKPYSGRELSSLLDAILGRQSDG